MERWRPPPLLTLLCLSFIGCDCNPYEGCEPRPPNAGERCVYGGFDDDSGAFDIQCRQGTSCDRTTGFCVQTPQLGDPCRLGELNCADEFLCASRSGVCVTPGGRGADCEEFGAMCNEGLVCNLGTCIEPESPGSGCDATTACPPDTTCNGAADPDPRRGECLAPQTAGGPCVWRPWVDDPGASGCAFGFSCRPPDPPDPLAPGVDETYLDCRDAEDGDDPCFGLVGTCVADGSLDAGEPCIVGSACVSGDCSNAAAPWGLPEIDGYACTGDDCAEFAWPGFCVGEGESQEGRSCNNVIEGFDCARGLVCPDISRSGGREDCEPPGRSDDGEPCGVLFEGYIPIPELCVVGLECVEETLECRRPGPGSEGDVCTVFSDCGAGLGCSDAGRCAPYPTVGEACGAELPCTNAQCNRRDSQCSAVTEARFDVACDDDTDCPRGTFCWIENTRQCRRWADAGGLCNGDGVVCEFGFVCRESGVGSNRSCLPPE